MGPRLGGADTEVDIGANGTCTPVSAHKFGCKAENWRDGFIDLVWLDCDRDLHLCEPRHHYS